MNVTFYYKCCTFLFRRSKTFLRSPPLTCGSFQWSSYYVDDNFIVNKLLLFFLTYGFVKTCFGLFFVGWKNGVPGQARPADIRISSPVYKYGALTNWATGAYFGVRLLVSCFNTGFDETTNFLAIICFEVFHYRFVVRRFCKFNRFILWPENDFHMLTRRDAHSLRDDFELTFICWSFLLVFFDLLPVLHRCCPLSCSRWPLEWKKCFFKKKFLLPSSVLLWG